MATDELRQTYLRTDAVPAAGHARVTMDQEPLYFQPWVGRDYRTSPLFGARVLVVGESHYGNEAWNYPEFTIDCVKEQVEGLGTKSFWTNIALTFLGRMPTPDDKLAFWNSVAFYNYVQTLVGPEARMRPKREMWPRSEDAFAQVLDELQPEFALLLGYALWDNAPDLDGRAGPEIAGAAQTGTWLYPLRSGGSCLAYGIRHPSSGFNGRQWHDPVRTALALAAGGSKGPVVTDG